MGSTGKATRTRLHTTGVAVSSRAAASAVHAAETDRDDWGGANAGDGDCEVKDICAVVPAENCTETSQRITRRELYSEAIDCVRRWVMKQRICGVFVTYGSDMSSSPLQPLAAVGS